MGQSSADDVDAIAAVPDAALVADAVVDADVAACIEPTGTLYEFCTQPFFELPMSVSDDPSSYHIESWDLGEGGVAYGRHSYVSEINHVSYLDLETCTEYLLAEGPGSGIISLDGDELLWIEHDVAPEYWRDNQVIHYDLSSWCRTVFLDTEYVTWRPFLRGQYILYEESLVQWEGNWEGGNQLLLHDRQTQLEQQLMPRSYRAGKYQLTDQYALWLVLCDPADSNSDTCLRFHDLQSGTEDTVWVRSVTGRLMAVCRSEM